MNKLDRFVSRVLTISFVAVGIVCLAQGWVRWQINQDFTFFGGFQLEAITLGAFALLFLLVWKARGNAE